MSGQATVSVPPAITDAGHGLQHRNRTQPGRESPPSSCRRSLASKARGSVRRPSPICPSSRPMSEGFRTLLNVASPSAISPNSCGSKLPRPWQRRRRTRHGTPDRARTHPAPCPQPRAQPGARGHRCPCDRCQPRSSPPRGASRPKPPPAASPPCSSWVRSAAMSCSTARLAAQAPAMDRAEPRPSAPRDRR